VTSNDGTNTPQYEIECNRFLSDLIIEIESRAAAMTSQSFGESKYYLLEAAKNFRAMSATWLYEHFKQGMEMEVNIWNRMNQTFDGVFQEIENLLGFVRDNEAKTSSLHQLHNELNGMSQNGMWNNDYYNQNVNNSDQLTRALVENIKQIVVFSSNCLIGKIYGFLSQWNFNQVQEANGAPPSTPTTLDVLQSLFENLAKILWQTREQVKVVKILKQGVVYQDNSQDIFLDLYNRCTELLENIIKNSLVIEKQPSQIVKTNIK
jgi:hypothetical protein